MSEELIEAIVNCEEWDMNTLLQPLGNDCFAVSVFDAMMEELKNADYSGDEISPESMEETVKEVYDKLSDDDEIRCKPFIVDVDEWNKKYEN